MEETLVTVFHDNSSPELLAEVTDYEMYMENTMLVPRAGMVDWMKELSRQGKRVLIVSDIYLPADLLKRIADHADLLEQVTDVISSADSFLAKASGNAFPLLQEKFGLEKKGWLHVGDNPISDGLRPSEFGLQALVLLDSSEKRRKSIIKRQVNYGEGRPFWRGRALQQLMLPLEAENSDHAPLYIEGYNFLSPLVAGFVQQLAERSRELGISKIFFLSREGWTFKKVWEQITPVLFPAGNLPEIEYLYVSRMALAGASCACQGLTQANADIAFLPAGNRDFRDVCRIFGLDAEELAPFLRDYRLEIDTVLSPHHDGFVRENRIRFNELLEDDSFQEAV
jgi:predicted HAD superfamily hydrolase